MWPDLLLALLLQSDPSADGIRALEARDYPQAIASFEKAAAADPADYSAWFHLGLAHSLGGNRGKAIESFRKTLEIKAGLYEAELNLGMLLLEQKQTGEAMPLLKSAFDKKPKEFRPAHYLAEALAAAEQHAPAEQQFRLALEIDPKSAQALAGLGRALLRQDKLKEAEPVLRQAGDADGMLELASRFEKSGDKTAWKPPSSIRRPPRAGMPSRPPICAISRPARPPN
jgi:Tfp pilus assembly protein PilF